MTGVKTLEQVRAELEAALGAGPTGKGEVAESLRRFLAAGTAADVTSHQPPTQTGTPKPAPASELGR